VTEEGNRRDRVPDADRSVAEDLAEALPPGTVTDDPDVLRAHSRDRAALCPGGNPAVLVRARSRDDVVATMAVAARRGAPVVPQGARSGIAGAANAVDGCILLSTERMERILDIDTRELTARIEPGVLNADLSRRVGESGLFYPPDPSSWEFSTIGGNVATNAGGLCCVKYGVTADYVRALEVVLADGRVLRTGTTTVKGVAGYDLARLFVGSEGTLGVITEIVVSLVPRPATPATAVAFFPSVRAACEVVADVAAAGLRPSMMELLDRSSIDIVQSWKDLGVAPDVRSMLLVQADGIGAAADVARIAEVIGQRGGTAVVADDPAEAALLLEARRALGTATENLGTALVEDVCVPRGALADLVEGVERIGREHGVRTACAGHAGDGNLHPKILFDSTDPAATTRARAAFDAVMELGLQLGGTITGEHGVGVLKRDWLERELGPVSLDVHRAVKDALDPRGLLNPGTVLAARRSGHLAR
jgi:glycolate oxidase